jgi:hypothetical protein
VAAEVEPEMLLLVRQHLLETARTVALVCPTRFLALPLPTVVAGVVVAEPIWVALLALAVPVVAVMDQIHLEHRAALVRLILAAAVGGMATILGLAVVVAAAAVVDE